MDEANVPRHASAGRSGAFKPECFFDANGYRRLVRCNRRMGSTGNALPQALYRLAMCSSGQNRHCEMCLRTTWADLQRHGLVLRKNLGCEVEPVMMVRAPRRARRNARTNQEAGMSGGTKRRRTLRVKPIRNGSQDQLSRALPHFGRHGDFLGAGRCVWFPPRRRYTL